MLFTRSQANGMRWTGRIACSKRRQEDSFGSLDAERLSRMQLSDVCCRRLLLRVLLLLSVSLLTLLPVSTYLSSINLKQSRRNAHFGSVPNDQHPVLILRHVRHLIPPISNSSNAQAVRHLFRLLFIASCPSFVSLIRISCFVSTLPVC